MAPQAGAIRDAALINSTCFSDDLKIQNTSSGQDLRVSFNGLVVRVKVKDSF